MSDLLAWAAHNDVSLDDLDARSPSLETVFLSIADAATRPTAITRTRP